ncbi:hypothetical protein [Streptomyces tauricus]
MLIHPWDAPHDDSEWQQWLAVHDFGQLAVNGLPELLNRQVGHFQPEGGSAEAAVGEDPYGRLLPGIRGLRLEVTGVRAKFKYANHRTEEVQNRVAAELSARAGPRDAAARAQLMRRRRA